MTIRRVKGGFQLRSKSKGPGGTTRNLGTFKTRAGAERRERQVQRFKK